MLFRQGLIATAVAIFGVLRLTHGRNDRKRCRLFPDKQSSSSFSWALWSCEEPRCDNFMDTEINNNAETNEKSSVWIHLSTESMLDPSLMIAAGTSLKPVPNGVQHFQ